MNKQKQANPQPINNQATKYANTKFDAHLTFGQDGGQQQMSSLDISVCSYLSTNIKQLQKKLLQQIQSKQELKQDILLVFRFIVQKGRQKDAMQFFQKGLDQQKEDMNISAIQTLFHRPKSAGQVEVKQCQGSILVIYRLYKQYLVQTQQLFSGQGIGKYVDVDMNIRLILKGSIVPCKKSFVALKPDYINMHIISTKTTVFDIIQYMYRNNEIEEQIYNNDLLKLLKNLQNIKINMKFNSFRKFIDYYNQITQSYLPIDKNGQKIYNDQNVQNNDQNKQFPLLNKGIFKQKIQFQAIYSDKLAVNAIMTFKKQEVLFKLIAILKKAFQKEIK